MPPLKYTAEEINHQIRIYFNQCKKARRIPYRSGLASQMEVTTRTLWTYRHKHPDLFHDMDVYAIKESIGKVLNKDGMPVEKMLLKMLRWYKPYFKDKNPTVLPVELQSINASPMKIYLMKLGMQVGMKFSISKG